ncbi:MAG: SurA N-terminal domain-containing protein [Gammaproteobacteria bacterium]|nr:SurA N-terminal domain-containing protein [Gammaproteobacteria bacterium]
MVLQSIRDRLHGIIAIFIFAILIIPFAFVGVNSYFTSDAQNAVALVNEQEITVDQFNRSFQNYRRRMQAQLGTSFDPEMFDQLVVRRQFLDQMINEELMSQVSVESGLAVSNDRLAQEIRGLAGFEVDGEFNVDVYQQRLASMGMTPQQFENDMRASLVMDQFPRVIAQSAISTEWEMREYARLQEQQRSFRAIVVPAQPGPDTADETDESEPVDSETAEPAEEAVAEAAPEMEISEEDILAWYEENSTDYLSEEQVIIEYLELDAAMLGGAIEPEEEQLRARFEEQQARFVTPEARLASHILIEVPTDAPQVDVDTARQAAEDLAERAEAGEDFAVLARESSQDIGSAEEGGDLGWIEPGYMVQAFEDALYELTPENPISEPIKTGFGWHVINLREIRPSEGMTYAEAREILLAEYQAEADERRFLEQADRMIDIIYEDPTTLSAAAEELGLEVLEAGPFGRGGEDEGVAANMDVVNTAFSELVLAQGAVSDPVDLGTNHIVVVRLGEHLPEALKPLGDVRDEVVAAVTRQRAMEAAQARAETLLARVEAEGDLEAISTAEGLELITAEDVMRVTVADYDPQLLRQAFQMERPGEGGPRRAVFELADGYAVVELESVADGVIGEDEALRAEAYKRRIANGTASEEALGFVRMLRSQSIIEIYEERL